MKRAILLIIILQFCMFGIDAQNTKYIRQVLNTMEEIETYRYFLYSAGSASGEGIVFNSHQNYVLEYTNPLDKEIKASYIKKHAQDTSKINYIYDGTIYTSFDWETKQIEIEDFENYPENAPFPVLAPFFSNVKSILEYMLAPNDSVELTQHDYGDSLMFGIKVYDKVIEFNGTPFYFDCPSSPAKRKVSQYEVWIDKASNLPYRMKRTMPHQISYQICRNIEFSAEKAQPIRAEFYFPADFTITDRKSKVISAHKLKGKKAPSWALNDLEGNEFVLDEVKSKVVLIQFSGVGCGPCHAAIPFLRQLNSEYNKQAMTLISIEGWNRDAENLKRFTLKNNIDYYFLLSTDEVQKKYNVMGVPIFFVLDQNRIIQSVIIGYQKNVTDSDIRKAINELL